MTGRAEEAVFRPAALERRDRADELDELLTFTPPHEWLLLAAVAALVVAAAAWAAFGSIAVRVEGEGWAASGRAVLLLPAGADPAPAPGAPARVEVVGGGAALDGGVRGAESTRDGRMRVEIALAGPLPPGDSLPARGTVTVGRVRPVSLLVPGRGGGW